MPKLCPSTTPDRDLLLAATGRDDLDEAFAWLAEGHPLRECSDVNLLLQAAVSQGLVTDDYSAAVRRLARQAATSTIDTAAVLFDVDSIVARTDFRGALDSLAQKCKGRSLDGISADAVVASQRTHAATVQALCAVAGISYRDLADWSADRLPSDPRGDWSPAQVRTAFAVIDRVIRGTDFSILPGAVPTRPIEFILSSAAGGAQGWDDVERMRVDGVPYELLLAQRTVGSAWGAHRNRTSLNVKEAIVDEVCAALEARQVRYRRSKSVGGDIEHREIQRLAEADGQVAIVILTAAAGPAHAIVFSTARDGGTARKNAARLAMMGRSDNIPISVLVSGPGWATRNETADLAFAFDGRIYSDRSVDALANAMRTNTAPRYRKDRDGS